MQLGISSYSLPWLVGVPGFNTPGALTATGLLREAEQVGVRHLQYGDNLPLHQLPEEVLHSLQQQSANSRITLEAGTRGLTIENISRYLHIAQVIQSPFLRVVMDDTGYQPAVAEVTAIIKTLLPALEAAGVVLAIENHDRFPAAVLRGIIEQTSTRWVGICLDTANSLGANEGIETVLHQLAPYTINLHIKDIRIERVSHKMGFTVKGCAAGAGILNIPEIIHHITAKGRCLSATLELWPEAGPNMDATIATERQLFNQSIDYLKTILP